jgi:ParB family chromosome partitioning protein
MTTAVAPSATEIVHIPISSITPHPRNRKRFDEASLKELAGSITDIGQLTPALVRPFGDGYQLLAGERRWRAVKIADLPTLSCLVRELDDQRALEVLMVENNHREDPHPLEEAEIYKDLLEFKGNTVQSLAVRLHRTTTYIYDRLKLLSLVPAAKKYFLENALQLGHAIILARLTASQQKEIIGTEQQGHSVLFTHELTLDGETRKTISPRELQSYVDKHIRFDAKKADPMLFADTVAGLALAEETGEKVVAITDLTHLPDEARDEKVRTFFPASWQRADGKEGSKTCEHSVIGNMVAGTERGALIRVCIAKKKCEVHWPDEVKAEKRKAKAEAKGGEAPKKNAESEQARQAKREEKIKEMLAAGTAEGERYKKALPAIREAIAERIGSMTVAQLVDLTVERKLPKEWSELLPVGRTADSALRHLAAHSLAEAEPHTASYYWEAQYASYQDEVRQPPAIATMAKMCKAVGLDARKLVDAAVPAPKPEKSAKAKPAKGKKVAK